MNKEIGTEAGMRNIGRLFLWSIPLSLGVAATVWFGLWVSGWEFQQKKAEIAHELTQQERSAVYVGAEIRPKGKLAVQIIDKSCFKIVRADIDLKSNGYESDALKGYVYSLILYGQGNCKNGDFGEIIPGYPRSDSGYRSWNWEMLSPNGTILDSGYTNHCPSPSGKDEIAECRFEIGMDERADKFRVWGTVTP
jgi:hypothetical protein